jgi:hypothetical protein
MSATPRRVKGAEVRVGDVILTKLADEFIPLLTVTEITTEEMVDRHGPTGVIWINLEAAEPNSGTAIMADDSTWVLRS